MKRKKKLPIDPRDTGTPETARRLGPDIIELLRTRQTLSDAQALVAFEIRGIREALESRFLSSSFGRLRLSGSRKTAHPLDGLPSSVLVNYMDRYVPWMRAVEVIFVRGVRMSELAMSIISNDKSTGSWDRECGWRKGTAKRALQNAIDLYGR
jgi:hypothetical protein